MSTYGFVLNQGYKSATYPNEYNTDARMGMEERLEMIRADDIDFYVDYKLKEEKRRAKYEYDDEDSW